METTLSNPLLIAVIILGALDIALLAAFWATRAKLQAFLHGPDSKHIGDSLISVSDELKELNKFKSDTETYLSSVESRLKKSVQSVHTIRFNPFKGTGSGGNQSFATVFLSEDGDGVIVSSLYSRERVSIFSKPIRAHISEFELSTEEKEALEGARNNLAK